MGDHDTWFHLLPGFRGLESKLVAMLNEPLLFDQKEQYLVHVVMALFVLVLLTVWGLNYRKKIAAAGDEGVLPADSLDSRGLIEIILDATMGLMRPIMGEQASKAFLPLIGTMALFILVSNLMGLVPGFLPATDNLNTTFACASVIFVATHVYGLKANGIEHIKHLFGPVIWLAPLMFVIEVISHLVRPISLALRLFGNMVGDHKVLGIFLTLVSVPFLIPVPALVLGFIVCVVQALVFSLLSVIYIGMAIEEHHHEEEHAH